MKFTTAVVDLGWGVLKGTTGLIHGRMRELVIILLQVLWNQDSLDETGFEFYLNLLQRNPQRNVSGVEVQTRV
jgi:hypothetical protein